MVFEGTLNIISDYKWYHLQPAAPSIGRGGMVQKAITSLSDLIDSSFLVRSASNAAAWLFLPKKELQSREMEQFVREQ